MAFLKLFFFGVYERTADLLMLMVSVPNTECFHILHPPSCHKIRVPVLQKNALLSPVSDQGFRILTVSSIS